MIDDCLQAVTGYQVLWWCNGMNGMNRMNGMNWMNWIKIGLVFVVGGGQRSIVAVACAGTVVYNDLWGFDG